MDWHQIWEITSAPDNVPIVAMLFLVPFYTWYGLRQARASSWSCTSKSIGSVDSNEVSGSYFKSCLEQMREGLSGQQLQRTRTIRTS